MIPHRSSGYFKSISMSALRSHRESKFAFADRVATIEIIYSHLRLSPLPNSHAVYMPLGLSYTLTSLLLSPVIDPHDGAVLPVMA